MIDNARQAAGGANSNHGARMGAGSRPRQQAVRARVGHLCVRWRAAASSGTIAVDRLELPLSWGGEDRLWPRTVAAPPRWCPICPALCGVADIPAGQCLVSAATMAVVRHARGGVDAGPGHPSMRFDHRRL